MEVVHFGIHQKVYLLLGQLGAVVFRRLAVDGMELVRVGVVRRALFDDEHLRAFLQGGTRGAHAGKPHAHHGHFRVGHVRDVFFGYGTRIDEELRGKHAVLVEGSPFRRGRLRRIAGVGCTRGIRAAAAHAACRKRRRAGERSTLEELAPVHVQSHRSTSLSLFPKIAQGRRLRG